MTPASNVYCGRGFLETLKAVRECAYELHIISAGLGLIPSGKEIPSYSLTISPSVVDSIQPKIFGSFSAPDWWLDLNVRTNGSSTPLANLIQKNDDAMFVLALSRSYAEMIVDDLLSLAATDLQRVRILGLSRPDYLPEPLKNIWMPYDERFDGPDNIGIGTRSDFPQRVACHFLRHIYRDNEYGDPRDHAQLIKNFLEGKCFPVKVQRISHTNDGIRAMIRENWDQAKGTSSKMLRVLRDDLLVACEQKRFSQLFNQVKAERNELA